MLNKKWLIAAGLCLACLPASAFAADLPSTEYESSSTPTAGSTDLIVKIADRSEVSTPNENLLFIVPTKINFVAKADGTLLGPSNVSIDLAYIKNQSAYKAFVSGYETTAVSGWNVVEDASTIGTGVRNAVSVEMGPSGDTHHLAEGGSTLSGTTQKAIVGPAKGSKIALTSTAWNMNAKDSATDADKVKLVTEGKIANVDANINGPVKFANVNWYLTPGDRA